MDVMARRCLIVAAVCALLAPAAAWGSTRVNPTAVARACAGGHPIRAGLAAGDAAFLGRFAACVLRQERSQFGLAYTQTAALSHVMLRALKRWAKLPYLKQHRQLAADRALLEVGKVAAAATCPDPRHARWADSYGETLTFPNSTPLRFARDLALWFKESGAVATAPGAVFGVASRPGVICLGPEVHRRVETRASWSIIAK